MHKQRRLELIEQVESQIWDAANRCIQYHGNKAATAQISAIAFELSLSYIRLRKDQADADRRLQSFMARRHPGRKSK